MACGNISSPGNRTCTPSVGAAGVLPLDCQESPQDALLKKVAGSVLSLSAPPPQLFQNGVATFLSEYGSLENTTCFQMCP